MSKSKNSKDDVKDFRAMTATSIGTDLLQCFVAEIKLLPEPWVKLSEGKQNDVIDRVRSRVDANVKMAVHLLASQGRTVVAGDLDQITIKDGVKAVIKFSAGAESLHDLYDAQNKAVLVVVANAADHTAGMDEVRGESDQRSFGLGKEYTDGDGDGMGDKAGGDVIDVQAIEHTHLQSELDQAFSDGYHAAMEGKPDSAAPIIAAELVKQWIRGWNKWHEDNPGAQAA